MDVRVITLRYQEGTQGFSEQALARPVARAKVAPGPFLECGGKRYPARRRFL